VRELSRCEIYSGGTVCETKSVHLSGLNGPGGEDLDRGEKDEVMRERGRFVAELRG
jgi:hypothetical protein